MVSVDSNVYKKIAKFRNKGVMDKINIHFFIQNATMRWKDRDVCLLLYHTYFLILRHIIMVFYIKVVINSFKLYFWICYITF